MPLLIQKSALIKVNSILLNHSGNILKLLNVELNNNYEIIKVLIRLL